MFTNGGAWNVTIVSLNESLMFSLFIAVTAQIKDLDSQHFLLTKFLISDFFLIKTFLF